MFFSSDYIDFFVPVVRVIDFLKPQNLKRIRYYVHRFDCF